MGKNQNYQKENIKEKNNGKKKKIKSRSAC